MRRILTTNICATFRYFVIKLSDDKKISLWSAKKELNTTNFGKIIVCNMCGKQFMAKKGLSDHNWAVHTEVESPCAMFVTKYSESKSNWHATFWQHM